MRKVAQAFSAVFHPLFIPLFALPLYFSIDSYENLIIDQLDVDFLHAIYSVMVLVGVLFPLISLYIMIRTRMVSDFNAFNRSERTPVFILVLSYYLMVYFMYRSWNSSIYHLLDPLLNFLSGGIYLIVIALLINFKTKISLHSISMSAFCGAFLIYSITLTSILNPLYLIVLNCILLLIMGAVASSRLYLKAHKPNEVYLGLLVGFVVEIGVVFFELSI